METKLKAAVSEKITWFTSNVRHHELSISNLVPPTHPIKKLGQKQSIPFHAAKTDLRLRQYCKSIAKIHKFDINVNENNQSTNLFIVCFHKSNNNQAFFPKPKLYSTFYHFVTQQKHIRETMTMLQIYQQNQQF